MSTTSTTQSITSEQKTEWFENLISEIKVDQLQVELGVANPEKSEFYNNLMTGKHDEVLKKVRFEVSQSLIEIVVKTFISNLNTRNAIPEKLAFALTPSTIMVWAEIKDDDERVEDGVLLTEAKVNAFAKQYDFSLDTMIVEASDSLPIPSHYTEVNIKRRMQAV